jgi:Response regulator containing CheY-like receiver domain and AraC-type DNA-binding domain
MIVDDEPFVREGLKELISWEAYDFQICGEADNGKDAIELAERFKPDLLITDIKMPEMSGLELIKICCERLKLKTKYIVLSGYNDFQFAKSALEFGVVNYILKPVDEGEIENSLKRIRADLEKDKVGCEIAGDTVFISTVIQKYIEGECDSELLLQVIQSTLFYESSEFYYIAIEPIKWQAFEKNKILQDIRSDLLNYFQDSLIIVQKEKYWQGIIISDKSLKKHNKTLDEILKAIKSKLEEKLNIKLVIYIGKRVEDFESIKDSYISCLSCRNINFIYEKEGIIDYNEYCNISLKYNFSKENLLNELLEAVERYNIEKIEKNIEHIFYRLKNEFIDPEIFKTAVLDFQIEVINLINDLSGDKTWDFGTINLIDLKISEVKEQLYKFCCSSSELINTIWVSRKSNTLQTVKNYIDLNYNEELSLKNLSEIFHVNQVYLGQVFKKTFGNSFSEYLNMLRIEKAKGLLKNSDLKICEIACKVGYNDPNYFFLKFEKLVKVTPKEYQRLVRNES